MNKSLLVSRPLSSPLDWLRVVLVPLLLAVSLAGAVAGADDDYMRIFNGIQDADAIAKSGKAEQALTKYRELYHALNAFKKENPEWDPQVLNFRLGYVTQRIQTLTDELNKIQESAATTKSAPAGGSQVKVLDPGAEPRTALRVHPAAGDKQTTLMKILMGMEMKMGDMQVPAPKIPEFSMGIETTVTEVSPEGDVQYSFAFTSLDVAESPDTPAQVVEAMKTSLNSLKGVAGKATISSRGEQKKMVFDRAPSTAADPMSPGLNQAEELFSSMGVTFPEEAVGKGARWEVKRPVKSQGMTIDQIATYELVELEGDTTTIKTSLKQSAANQKMATPAQPGMNMTLEKMTGSGTGTSTYELSRLMATKGSAKLHSDLVTSMAAQGQKQQIAMKMDYTITLESK